MNLTKFCEFPTFFVSKFGYVPYSFDPVCTSTCCWIYKIFAVFHSLILITLFFYIIVRFPLVRNIFAACNNALFLIGITNYLVRFSTASKNNLQFPCRYLKNPLTVVVWQIPSSFSQNFISLKLLRQWVPVSCVMGKE